MLDRDTQLACEHAIDELRCNIDELDDTPLKTRVMKRIEELEGLVYKLIQSEIKSRKTYDYYS